jgi:hypothetical protein
MLSISKIEPDCDNQNETIEWATVEETDPDEMDGHETYQIVETLDNSDTLKPDSYQTEELAVGSPPLLEEVVHQEISSRIHKPATRKSHSQQSQNRIPDKEEIDNLLSIFLIGCNLTFEVVDSEYFRNFVKKLAPNYQIPNSKELTRTLVKRLSTPGSSNSGFAGSSKRSFSTDSDDSQLDKRQKI